MKTGSEPAPSPLHKHLLRWMERKLNPNLSRNPFDAKERQVRRRQQISDSKMIATSSPPSSALYRHIRAEHKAHSTGLSILHLPRLPFGCHKTYNDETHFMQQHIVSRDASPSQIEELNSITRLYRLLERKKLRKTRYANSTDYRKSAQFDHYESESGLLICPKEQRLLEAYESDRAKYRAALSHSCTPVPPRQSPARSVALPSQRLYRKPPSPANLLSRTLTQRFAGLFESKHS